MAEVAFVARVLTHYRLPFHTALRDRLAARHIHYRLLHSRPTANEAKKQDFVAPAWAEDVPIRYFTRAGVCWQSFAGRTKAADLVIIGQESKLLANYPAQLFRRFGQRRLAFFGHGKNFQSQGGWSAAERFKRFWATRVDWWFAYTELTADIVAGYGFPRDRITVFNNAIDTSAIRAELGTIGRQEQEDLRQRLFGGSNNVGVYIGGLYREKRIPFLLESAKLIRKLVPDFRLLVIGGGADADLVEDAARNHAWISYVGPKFGREKSLLAGLGKVQLMPGLLGLGILDSFAYSMPVVTTNIPFHSPEFSYLSNGHNGVVVGDADDAEAYATAVVRVLKDEPYRFALQEGAQEALETYTIEAMADRFAEGIFAALGK